MPLHGPPIPAATLARNRQMAELLADYSRLRTLSCARRAASSHMLAIQRHSAGRVKAQPRALMTVKFY